MKSSIIVVGAGFAGLEAANRIAAMNRGSNHRIKLIDCNPYTTMVPALPDIAGGHYDPLYVTEDVAAIAAPSILFCNERVNSVKLNERKVETEQAVHDYDYLVLAMGSTTDFDGFDQSLESVYKLDTLDDAKAINRAFKGYLRDCEAPNVVISGAGYTGFEIACNLQFVGSKFIPPPRITIVELKDRVLPSMPDHIRDYIAHAADKRGMELKTGDAIKNYDGHDIEFSSGEVRKDAFLCWSTGTKRSISAIFGDYEQLPDGRIEVDDCLRIPKHPEVFVAGDAAALRKDGEVLRKAVNFSIGSGQCAGGNVVRAANGKTCKIFRPVDLGWIIPFCDVGAGRIFSRYRVSGKLPIALHYLMCSRRNYNFKNRIFYIKRALRSLV